MEWRTPRVPWSDLPQITDSYVVHARGFTIDGDVWFDPYSVRSSHSGLWSDVVSDHYDIEWDGSGHEIDEVLYWSITGSETFVIDHPPRDDNEARITELLDELEVPDDAHVRWGETTTAGEIRHG